MTMTVAALHKRLGALIEAGHGRKPVLVNKPTFTHPLEEDGAVMLDVAEVTQPRWIGMCDDDGGTKWNRDGSESGRTAVLLLGEREQTPAGAALPPATPRHHAFAPTPKALTAYLAGAGLAADVAERAANDVCRWFANAGVAPCGDSNA